MAAFYDDLIFPPSIALYSFKGSRLRQTRVTVLQSGFTQRKSEWARTQRSYDAGLVARPADQWRLIDDFFEIAEGQAIGFLLLDPTDYQCDQASGLLSVTTMTNVYSLQKVRTVASHSSYRAIGKPNPATVVVFRTRSSVTTVVDPSHYVLDAVNGTVTFAGGYAMVGDTFAWSGQFYVPARFSTDDLDWTSVDKSGGQLLISGPSIPITEDPQDGLLYIPPT